MKKAILTILLLICVGVCGFSVYKLYEIHEIKETVKNETEDLMDHTVDENQYFSVDWKALQQENEDIIAWIYIPECDISYPVLQGKDNNEYLRTTVKGEYNVMGSIFLDAHANKDFTDDNSIIYGHSVEGGGMFSKLDQFEDKEFFDSHPYYYILTPNQNYRCDIMTFAKTTESSAFYTTSFGDYRDEVIQEMETTADFYRPMDTENARFVTLSTCDLDYGYSSLQRLALVSVLQKYDEPIKAEVNK